MGDVDFRFYLSIFLKRLPLFLLVAVSTLTIGITAALFMPPLYRASARILVEAPQIPTELARSTVSTSAVEQMAVTRQQITTRAYLLDLANRLHVYERRKGLSNAYIVDNMQSRIRLEQVNIQDLGAGQGATIFSVSFDAKDPILAANVVNEIVAFILGKNKSLRSDLAEDTQNFFQQEVKRLGSELNRIESAILKFKNENSVALPDSLEFRRSEQSRQQERLLLLEREESGLRSRRNHVVETFESTGRVISAGPLMPEQQLLQDLTRSLSEQLAIFSEDSPTIVTLRARIASLQKEQQKANAGGKTTPGSSELAMQLSEIDERLVFISKERAQITASLASLEKSIMATPNNESVLLSLQRDHANFQGQYNAAVANLAQASTGEQIESRSKGIKFSMVESATPPQNPVSPKRRVIAAAGLFGGVAGGVGLIVLLELLNKGMRRPQELVLSLGIQPLVTVPYIWLDGEKRGEVRKTAYLSAAATALVPVLLIAIHFSYMPIGSIFERVVGLVKGSGM